MQRVSMTLGRSSQAQNIAAALWLTFSRYISSSVFFFSLRCRSTRSSSSSLTGTFCAHQPLPTSKRHKPYLVRHLLQRHCWHLQHRSLQWRRWSLHCRRLVRDTALLELSGFTGLSANWSLPFVRGTPRSYAFSYCLDPEHP